MKFRPSVRRRGLLQLETLEQRENPTATITAAVTGGVLTITGTDEAETITLKQTGLGLFQISGDNGTVVNGTADGTLTTTVAAKSVKVMLKGGDDNVTIDANNLAFAGAITVDAGDGNNTFGFSTTAAPASLGSLSYVGGNGSDMVSVGSPGKTSTINGGVKIATGNGGSTVGLYSVTSTGDVTVTAGTGTDSLTLASVQVRNVSDDAGLGDGALTVNGTSVLNGGLVYKALEGTDTISLTDTTIKGKTGVNISGGFGQTQLSTSGVVSVPAGGVTIAGTNGLAGLQVNSSAFTVAGDVRVTDTQISVTNNGTLTTGNLTLAGKDAVTMGGSGEWDIKKNLSATALSPVGTITNIFSVLNVDGNITMTSTGASSTTIGSGLVKGTASFASANGQAGLLGGTADLEFRKSLAVRGSGAAIVFGQNSPQASTGNIIVDGDVSVTATVSIGFLVNPASVMTLKGGLRVSGPLGASIQLSSTLPTGATVAKDVLLTCTKGPASFSINTKNLTISGKTTIVSAAPAALGLTTYAGGKLTFAKDVSVSAATQTSQIQSVGFGEAVFGGKVTVLGGPQATLSLIDTGTTGSTIAGDATVTSAFGSALWTMSGAAKAFNGNVSVKGHDVSFNQQSSTTATTSFAKNLTITGGAGNDLVTMNGLYSVTGDTTFNLGEGPSNISLSSTSTATDFTGKLTIKEGNGDSNTSFYNVQAGKDVSVTSLAGKDILTVDGGSVFSGAFLADTGAGDDSLALGAATGLSVAAATFNGKVTIKTGAGNDTIQLGTAT
ncbi:beta strand repeat-containing protein, partial [Zavarzinella formosa]|uniref:beta strand repeat-containing protein n=1 Tax=Zavarzinella formosa TaxID=360055 RepID=UPI00187D7EDD